MEIVQMDYEIVTLSERILAGITKRIPKQTPPMELWGEFYTKAISKIKGQQNSKAYGVYYDFNGDGCTAMVACEVYQDCDHQEGITQYTIPTGKYAKFCLTGEVHQVVPLFWQQVKELALERCYQCDFELFPSSDTDNVEIEVYISIK